MSGVSLQNVKKSYGDITVIPSIDLEIQEGEFLVIVGPSGCGKSTTLRMIAGLENITDGKIYIGGVDVTHLPPKKRDIAMVFQSYALYPHMNVYENMSFALRLAHVDKAEIEKRVHIAADMLELRPYLHRKPKDLSGGQRQRVAMGRSIVRDAYVFLFDEPLSNLDAKLRASMRTELALLHKKLNRTMIYVTHDQIEAMTMADRIVVMSDGVIQQVGTPQQLYTAPVNKFVAGFIGSPAMNFIDGVCTEHSTGYTLSGDGFNIPLTQAQTQRLQDKGITKVTMGLRPENFVMANDGQKPHLIPLQLQVNVSEYVGSRQYLAAQLGDVLISVSIETAPDADKLTSGTYYFDSTQLYLFDRQTGQVV